ncbi:MAG: hypothetical protein ACYCVD_03635 [Desulfitobacteriaceae bacterium]
MLIGEVSSGIVVLFMFILALLLTRHYLLKHRAYTFWWSISFWLAFLAAATDFVSYLLQGWSLLQYRVYLFSAATLVAYMGAGTLYIFSQKLGRIYVLLMSVVALAMAYTLSVTPVPGIFNMPAGEQARSFVPQGIGAYFGILSGIGAIALFVGALYSWFRSKLSYYLWIALGALVFSAGGMVGKYLGIFQLFYVFQAIGAVVLYYGIVSSFSARRSTLE